MSIFFLSADISFDSSTTRVIFEPVHGWGCSSAGRALASHARGRGFDSHHLHTLFCSKTLTENPPRYLLFSHFDFLDLLNEKNKYPRVKYARPSVQKCLGNVAFILFLSECSGTGNVFESWYFKGKMEIFRSFLLYAGGSRIIRTPIDQLFMKMQRCDRTGRSGIAAYRQYNNRTNIRHQTLRGNTH